MFKSATNQTNINPIDSNPITQFFEIGKLTACAGPELVWKIHDAFRKSDGKVKEKWEKFWNWYPASDMFSVAKISKWYGVEDKTNFGF